MTACKTSRHFRKRHPPAIWNGGTTPRSRHRSRESPRSAPFLCRPTAIRQSRLIEVRSARQTAVSPWCPLTPRTHVIKACTTALGTRNSRGYNLRMQSDISFQSILQNTLLRFIATSLTCTRITVSKDQNTSEVATWLCLLRATVGAWTLLKVSGRNRETKFATRADEWPVRLTPKRRKLLSDE